MQCSLCLACLVSRKRSGEEQPASDEGEGGGQISLFGALLCPLPPTKIPPPSLMSHMLPIGRPHHALSLCHTLISALQISKPINYP